MSRDALSSRDKLVATADHPGALLGIAAALLLLGCTSVDGGAVELSWKLRPTSSAISDKFVDCTPDPARFPSTNAVTRIRLTWEVAGHAEGSASWACEDSHGVTSFDLDAGDALLTVSPECAEGPADPRAFIAPPPIQRPVTVGDVVSLGAVELVLAVTACGDQPGQLPCICQ